MPYLLNPPHEPLRRPWRLAASVSLAVLAVALYVLDRRREPWEVWRHRIVEWDDGFWKLLERRMPDLWRVYRREHAVILADYRDWPGEMVDLLEKRWQFIKQLGEREHESR